MPVMHPWIIEPVLYAPAPGENAWNPGVSPGIPTDFLALETLVRPDCCLSTRAQADELAALCGLPLREIVLLRAERLALHEVILRVTADLAILEGTEEEEFGYNFRRVATALFDQVVLPQVDEIVAAHAALIARAKTEAARLLHAAYAPPPAPARPRFPRSLFKRRPAAAPATLGESAAEQDYRIVNEYKAVGLAAADPFQRALGKSLYRILGAVLAQRGRIGGSHDTLATLVSHHLANTFGSAQIGERIAPLLDAVIAREGWPRVPDQPAPVLISLKGASAAGKSSLRPMIKQRMAEHGIAEGGFGTISPDVWRRLLLDYAALGPARKYAGHLTSQELMLIDDKLDRHMRAKAEHNGTLPHLLVDRFRFDSFASEKVGRVLHNTYASHVDTMYMYFVVTPPEATVERGWQRALLRGRFKSVEDFLGHSVEAYTGMPKLLFKWMAYDKPVFRFAFLDNRVPIGCFPATIAEGDQRHIVIYDPLPLIDIERYQKINIHAASAAEVYPPAAELAVERNGGFLREILRRFPSIELVERGALTPYARRQAGTVEIIDPAAVERLRADAPMAAVLDLLLAPAR